MYLSSMCSAYLCEFCELKLLCCEVSWLLFLAPAVVAAAEETAVVVMAVPAGRLDHGCCGADGDSIK